MRKPVFVPVPSVPLDAFVLEELLIRTLIAHGYQVILHCTSEPAHAWVIALP